jgi:C4-type Zn-finger protein
MMSVQCPHCGTRCTATEENQPTEQTRLHRLYCASCGYQAMTTTSAQRDGVQFTQTITRTEQSQHGARSFSYSHSGRSPSLATLKRLHPWLRSL